MTNYGCPHLRLNDNSDEQMESSTGNSNANSLEPLAQTAEVLVDLEKQNGEAVKENDNVENQMDEETAEILSDIEELIEGAVDVDMEKYPPGATVKKKRVLEMRLADAFNILPDGWIEITHDSGLPHRASRVCTFSRPYFLGASSVRKHKVPISSIPCYYMRKRQAEIKAQTEPKLINRLIDAPAVELKSAGDKEHYIDDNQINDYAKNLFKFKTINVVRFKKWSDTRKFQRQRKREQGLRLNDVNASDRPGLPADTKLITVPALNDAAKPSFQTMTLNPVGKSSVALLHDFVQKILKNYVLYDIIEISNIATPYRCVARLGKLNTSTKVQLHQSVKAKLKILQESYEREATSAGRITTGETENKDGESVLGIGFGKSKKNAKMAAAEKVLNCLIPELKFNEEHVVIADSDDTEENDEAKKTKNDPQEVFDGLDICHARISEFCNRMGQQQPYIILKELIRRNVTMSDLEPKFTTERRSHQKCLYVLTVGKETETASGDNQREGKQRVSQKMLKRLFPNAKTYGDILRMYNADAVNMQKDAQRYKRKMTSQGTYSRMKASLTEHLVAAEDLNDTFAVSNEAIGAELRTALSSMEIRYNDQRNRDLVFRPPIGFTAPPLPADDCAHFGDLCKRFAHLFADDHLLNEMIE
ncbi:Microprocessor complex subunit DGCR8/PASHA [Aphelenchoides besseyi]|nr:Microprocessor complex subunit DGCR8/PASHA [Aphelenchoides besseyi]